MENYCPQCGTQNNGNKFCSNCGYSFLQNNNKQDIMTENKMYKNKENKKKKKPDSRLSIWALVLSLFIVTIPIAFILALVDLIGKRDNSERHDGSWFAVIMMILFFIFV